MVFKLEFGSGLQPAMKRVDEGLLSLLSPTSTPIFGFPRTSSWIVALVSQMDTRPADCH